MSPPSLSYNASSFLQTVGLVSHEKDRDGSPTSAKNDSFDYGYRVNLAENADDSVLNQPRWQQTSCRRTIKTAAARRFWADFTLGFADGLTVPFALTAGLSSLGRTDTVVYAGMAEVTAGCISMGISGYLSARQAASGSEEMRCKAVDRKAPDMLEGSRERISHLTTAARHYLAPLALPADLHQQLLAHVATQPYAAAGLLAAMDRNRNSSDGKDSSDYDDYGDKHYYETSVERTSDDAVWPVVSGVSVALGYLIGGLLPLWPYFFVQHVGDGLRYSFSVCVMALFLFGFFKDLFLEAPSSSFAPGPLAPRYRSRIPWRRLWKSAFEGLQMVVLGSIAAMAAVLCVHIFEGRAE
ncbi:hypothetical protein SEPCBS119000_002042 [Sporothrix epigloea]|uniref:Vacuolar iron transporter n=1 Tax=Sporothrix epigloea TaxID=1892477 RepID=A0ABP0DF89_9PEZI